MSSKRKSREADPAENGDVVEVEIKEDADLPSDDENSGKQFRNNIDHIKYIGATKYFVWKLMQTKGQIFRSII